MPPKQPSQPGETPQPEPAHTPEIQPDPAPAPEETPPANPYPEEPAPPTAPEVPVINGAACFLDLMEFAFRFSLN